MSVDAFRKRPVPEIPRAGDFISSPQGKAIIECLKFLGDLEILTQDTLRYGPIPAVIMGFGFTAHNRPQTFGPFPGDKTNADYLLFCSTGFEEFYFLGLPFIEDTPYFPSLSGERRPWYGEYAEHFLKEEKEK